MQVFFFLLPTEVGLAAASDVRLWQDLAQSVCFVTIVSSWELLEFLHLHFGNIRFVCLSAVQKWRLRWSSDSAVSVVPEHHHNHHSHQEQKHLD